MRQSNHSTHQSKQIHSAHQSKPSPYNAAIQHTNPNLHPGKQRFSTPIQTKSFSIPIQTFTLESSQWFGTPVQIFNPETGQCFPGGLSHLCFTLRRISRWEGVRKMEWLYAWRSGKKRLSPVTGRDRWDQAEWSVSAVFPRRAERPVPVDSNSS